MPKSRQRKVRVAIIDVGNCASSFVKGAHYFQDAPKDATPKQYSDDKPRQMVEEFIAQ